MFDVIIIGGGAAGLSAGLILGRFRRSVLICDSQRPRNAKSTGVHGFLSRDGIHPQELLQIARDQLAPLTTVEIRAQEVVDIAQSDGGFTVTFQNGTSETAKKILFATGVKDKLPSVEGVEDLFGKSVFHCPYCHGWEVRDQAIAILANGDGAVHLASLLHALSDDVVICTDGKSEINASDSAQLERLGIKIFETPVARLKHDGTALEGIAFSDGTFLQREAIFVRTVQEQHSQLPAKLGCNMTQQGYVAVDQMGKTNIEGVFAAGDLASPLQQVIHAASRGAAAAAFINTELAQEIFTAEIGEAERS